MRSLWWRRFSWSKTHLPGASPPCQPNCGTPAAGWKRLTTWKASTDPDFIAKMHRVLALYDTPPTDGRVICVDEFGPLNLMPRKGKAWGPVRRPRRLRATYNRYDGVMHMLAALDLATGKIYYRIRKRKRWREFLGLLKSLRARWPGEKLYVVLDNFSPHKHAVVRTWTAENDIELVFLPTSGPVNPTRIQRQRTKGRSKPPRCMIVDRTSHFGNPFTIAQFIPLGHQEPEARTMAVAQFRRASPQARELLLAVAYALCIAPGDPGRVLNTAARALGRSPATRRPRLDALVADDAPRYEPHREVGNWPPSQAPRPFHRYSSIAAAGAPAAVR
ncbi:IS630 family transposase [Streptomyces diastaticus]|uniref:IS630 family transposase n=2 Tax=Streptomyces diastaticus TaxID=1956 RepID=UPI003655181C